MKGGAILPTVAIVSTTCALIVQNRERIVGGAAAAAAPRVMTPLRQFFGRVFKKAQLLPFVPKKKNTNENNDEEEEKKEKKKKTKSEDEGEEEETTTTTTTRKKRKEEEEEEEETLSSSEKKARDEKRERERAERANEKGFEMITIRASSREDARKREQAKTIGNSGGGIGLFRKKKKTMMTTKKKNGDSSSEDEEEEEEKEEEEDVKIEVDISTFGAAIVALRVPSKDSEDIEDVVLGFNSVEEYAKVSDHPYFGAVVGRVANRIKDGKYTLDGVEYKCDRNDGDKHTLHGGFEGLDVKRWTLKDVSDSHVELSVLSGDLEQKGFPGNCKISVVYRVRIIERAKIRERKKESLLEAPSCELYVEKYASLTCEFKATTDFKTPICLAQHSYFNLSGCDSNEDVGYHLAQFPNVSKYLVLDDENIPTGEIRKCHEAFDFSEKRLVFAQLPPMRLPLGFDHNFCIDGVNYSRSVNNRPKSHFTVGDSNYSRHANIPSTRFDESLTHCASFESSSSGRTMDVYTDAPGFQFYTGNFLDGTTRGKNNVMYDANTGFCVETQWWPNAVNEKDFPDSVLDVGRTYVHNTCYEFGVNRAIGASYVNMF
jgi:aldose 1-epimerase